jgi:hypothetical protein
LVDFTDLVKEYTYLRFIKIVSSVAVCACCIVCGPARAIRTSDYLLAGCQHEEECEEEEAFAGF